MGYTVPVLCILFNRTDTAVQVLERLRIIRPERIYFAADGPRAEKNEAQACQAARDLIHQVDWPCSVQVLFSDNNQGARVFIGKAVQWFFEQEEEGIILEHDCLPHPDFFVYCKYLLEKYRHEPRIMHVTGTRFIDTGKSEQGYLFSHYNHIWGWATWRRAWKFYDLEMNALPEFITNHGIQAIFPSVAEQNFWLKKLSMAYTEKIGSWDYQWTFAIWNQGGLSVAPCSNLVSNIGFDAGAIHTKDKSHFLSNRPTYPWTIPSPSEIPELFADRDSELYDFRHVFYPPWPQRLINKIKSLI